MCCRSSRCRCRPTYDRGASECLCYSHSRYSISIVLYLSIYVDDMMLREREDRRKEGRGGRRRREVEGEVEGEVVSSGRMMEGRKEGRKEVTCGFRSDRRCGGAGNLVGKGKLGKESWERRLVGREFV